MVRHLGMHKDENSLRSTVTMFQHVEIVDNQCLSTIESGQK